jgi:FixJ family two-component response regulator
MATTCVCVIDGDPAVRDSLATLMHLSGHDVSTYSTGSAFLQAVNPELLKCVVCEAELPDTTGLAVYQALGEKNVTVPFALLVSHSDPSTVAAANRVGIRNVFYKPLVHRRLIAFVGND